jgi:hypothetical protein
MIRMPCTEISSTGRSLGRFGRQFVGDGCEVKLNKRRSGSVPKSSRFVVQKRGALPF